MTKFYCEKCGDFITTSIQRVYYSTEEDMYLCDKCAKVVYAGTEEATPE